MRTAKRGKVRSQMREGRGMSGRGRLETRLRSGPPLPSRPLDEDDEAVAALVEAARRVERGDAVLFEVWIRVDGRYLVVGWRATCGPVRW